MTLGTIALAIEAKRRLWVARSAYLTVWILVELMAVAVVAPLVSGATNEIIQRTDRVAVANEDILRFVLSPSGFLVIVLIVMVTLLKTVLAQSASILLASRSEDVTSSVRKHGLRAGILALIGVLRRILTIFLLLARQVAIVMLVAAPFLAMLALIAWLTVRDVDLYWLVQERPARLWIGVAVAAPIGLLMLVVLVRLVLRWSLALPLCLLEGRRSAEAMRTSVQLLQGRLWTVAVARLSWFGLISVVSIITLALVNSLAEFVLSRELGSLRMTAFVAGGFLLLQTVLVTIERMIFWVGDALLVFSMWKRWSPSVSQTTSDVTPSRAVLPSSDRSAQPGKRRSSLRWLRSLVLWGVTIVVIVSLVISSRLIDALDRPLSVEITAHRGAAAVAPENTLAAIREAMRLNADRIELDVMLTRDAEIVVFHDTDMRRLASDPRRVADLTLAELRQFDVGRWFDSAFTDERIPTLAEVLDATDRGEEGHFPLNIELKVVRGREQQLAEQVITLLNEREERNAVVTSLSVPALVAVRRADPDRPIGVILTASVGDVHRLDVDFYSVPGNVATTNFMAASARLERPVHAWGVSHPDMLTRAVLRGADGVIVNDIEATRQHIKELTELEPLERLLLAFRIRLLE